jgi:DNA-binding CsgD family transcriptional regulator
LLADLRARLAAVSPGGEVAPSPPAGGDPGPGAPDAPPAAAPGAGRVLILDIPPVPCADPLPEPADGQRLILGKRPATAVPGLARAEVYGRVSRYGPEDLLFPPEAFAAAGLPPDAHARTGGWACLIPAVLAEEARPGALAAFLREEVLAPLSSAALVAFAAFLADPQARIDRGLMRGLPFVVPGQALHPALLAVRGPLCDAIAELLAARAADPTAARAIATAQAAIGRLPEAIATFQSVGAWGAALGVLQQAGGPFFVHRFGPEAFDRMLAGFPPDLAARDETLVMCRAIRAVKRGEVRLTQRILADRWGEGIAAAGSVVSDRVRYSLPVRFFRLLLQTWEDFDHAEAALEPAYGLLAELPAEDHLHRGAFYNAVLEFYIRARRFAEAEHVALRSAQHYERAGIPILSFYVDLHRAIIRLFMGDPAGARSRAAAAARHLRATPYDSPGDARLLALLQACIDYETGDPSPLTRFLSLDADALAQGEIWPTLVELALVYGSQAMQTSYSTLSARAFLDRWRAAQERSSQFRLLIDIREVSVMQTGNRWGEAAAKASALGSRMTLAQVLAGEEVLATLSDRDEIALALVWLRHLAQTAPQRPGLSELIMRMQDNPHLTGRQRTAAAIWLAHVLRRTRRPDMARAVLARALGSAAQAGTVALVSEERAFLADLAPGSRLRAALDQHDPVRRLLRQARDGGAPGAATARAAGLTRQETRMLHALGEGAGNKAIANLLGLSEATVKFHLINLYRKLGVRSRREAVAAASALGLLA